MKWSYILIIITAVFATAGIIIQVKEKELAFIYFYVLLGLILAYAVIDLIKIRDADLEKEKKHAEIIGEIHSIKGVDKPPDQSFPGYSIIFLLKVNEQIDSRRKFIVDIGLESDRNRVSIYLDRLNNLVFRVFDNEAEPHVIKIPKRIHTFQLGTFYHFYCEYGIAPEYSFMRMFINNTEVGKILFQEKLNLPEELSNDQIKIGADLYNQNNSKFDIKMFSTAHATLSSTDRSTFINAHENYLREIEK